MPAPGSPSARPRRRRRSDTAHEHRAEPRRRREIAARKLIRCRVWFNRSPVPQFLDHGGTPVRPEGTSARRPASSELTSLAASDLDQQGERGIDHSLPMADTTDVAASAAGELTEADLERVQRVHPRAGAALGRDDRRPRARHRPPARASTPPSPSSTPAPRLRASSGAATTRCCSGSSACSTRRPRAARRRRAQRPPGRRALGNAGGDRHRARGRRARRERRATARRPNVGRDGQHEAANGDGAAASSTRTTTCSRPTRRPQDWEEPEAEPTRMLSTRRPRTRAPTAASGSSTPPAPARPSPRSASSRPRAPAAS